MPSDYLVPEHAANPKAPSVGVVLARGAGWGSLLGAICGLLVFPVDDLLIFRDEPFSPFSFLIGVYLAAPFGLLYGLVAGFISALCFLPARSTRRPALSARIISATIGPLVVGTISLLVFHPSTSIGGNETIEHVRERLLLFYWFPCTAAALSGALAGGRLARSTQGWAGETSDGGVHRDVAL